MKTIKKTRKVLYVIILVFLLFMLVGCKSKETIQEIHVGNACLYRYNSNNDYSLGQNPEKEKDVLNNYLIEIDENKFYILRMSIVWKYFKSHITNENQYPVIEIYEDYVIQYEIYFNDELIRGEPIIEIENTSKKLELNYSNYYIIHKLLDSTIGTQFYICLRLPLDKIGYYKIKYATTYFLNGEKRESSGEYSFVTISNKKIE